MKRTLVMALCAVVTMALAGPAFAQNPHFIRGHADATLDGTNLVVSFKMAGLGAGTAVDVTASSQVVAEYACQNRGGNFPRDPKKQTRDETVASAGTFIADEHGHVNETLTLSPPASTLECPRGQQAVLLELTYTDVTLSSPQARRDLTISGSWSA